MTGNVMYLCPHPGCTFRHTCLTTLAEHKREHAKPVVTQSIERDLSNE